MQQASQPKLFGFRNSENFKHRPRSVNSRLSPFAPEVRPLTLVRPGVRDAASVSYNGTLPAGGSASLGFQGTWTTSDAAPTAFTVNGAACG
jgi:Cellulose binding domain